MLRNFDNVFCLIEVLNDRRKQSLNFSGSHFLCKRKIINADLIYIENRVVN